MTQQQLIQEFQTYPRAKKSVVLRRLLKAFEDDLNENGSDHSELHGPQSVEDRIRAVERLAGIASVPGKMPPTDDEWREGRTDYLIEKYK